MERYFRNDKEFIFWIEGLLRHISSYDTGDVTYYDKLNVSYTNIGSVSTNTFIWPLTEDILKMMGEQIKLARLRRNLPAELVAERAGISRASLWKVESGNPAVAIGIYAAVLHALGGMDRDLVLVAKDDKMGRQMQDLDLMTRKRATRRKG